MNAERELHVLALNSGSSSLKFDLYRVRSLQTQRLVSGEAESIGEEAAVFHVEDPKGNSLLRESAALPTQKDAVTRVARLLIEVKVPVPQCIGHRIVHGGPMLKYHWVIDDSRSGDLDPGVLVYLARQKRLDATEHEELVDRRSGLLSVSGVSADLRDLYKAAHSNPDARLAIDMFCYSAAKQLAAMSAALGGVDAIVFTGGIGENDAQVRALICGHLGVLGVRLDAAGNRDAGDPISASASRCQVRVLPSQEDEQIARQAWTLY